MNIRSKLRRIMLLAIPALAAASLASAQTKLTGDGKCGKPDKQESVDVGDRTGHALALVHFSCTWATSFEMGGIKAKDYTGSFSADINGDKSQDRGYVVITMENGDKAFVRFTGSTTTAKDGSSTGGGTWSYAGGTGKMKGLTGKGTYKSTGTPDSGSDHIEGEYTLPAAPAPKAK